MVDQRLITLAHAYLDNQLAVEDAPELERALLENENFRVWFAQLHRRETALRAIMVQQNQAAVLRKSSRRLRSRGYQRFGKPQSIRYLSATSAALLLLGLGALALIYTWQKEPTGVAVVVASSLSDRMDDGTPLAVGKELPSGVHLQLSPSAQVRFATGAMLKVDEASTLVLSQSGCDLLAGGINLQVDPQPIDRQFRITTPQAALTVIGTRFSVKVTALDTHLSVSEGIVDMRTSEGIRRVAAGQTAQSPKTNLKSVANESMVASGAVDSVSLYDPTTNRPIQGYDPLVDGAIVDLSLLTGGRAGLVFKFAPDVLAIRPRVIGPSSGIKSAPFEVEKPFTYPNDTQGDIRGSWILVAGTYQVVVTKFADVSGKRPIDPPLKLHFTVVDRR